MKPSAANPKYRVMCLRIVPKSGPIVRFTNHVRDLTMSNAQVYMTNSGYDFTSYTASSGMAASMVDLEGVLGLAGIGRDQLSSGQYDNARAYLFATTWNAPVEDEEPITLSLLGKVQFIDDRYRVEEMGLVDVFGQSVGDTYTPNCQKTFGGQEFAGCKKDLGPLTVSGSLNHVLSNYVFQDELRTEEADWFGAGLIWFTSGPNAGLPAKEIKRYEADGVIEIFEPFYYDISVNDEYQMTPGCRKRLEDCKKHNNILNSGGFTFIPVSSKYQQVGTK
jgi:uncharacterized phage protein (TIGR02218 family)